MDDGIIEELSGALHMLVAAVRSTETGEFITFSDGDEHKVYVRIL